MDARNRVLVPLALVALKKHRAVDLHIPQSDRAILMASGDEAAIVQEGHATEL